MTQEEAKAILNELSNQVQYNIEIIPYCYEYIVEISHKEMFKTSMYVNAGIVGVIAKYGREFLIQTIGNGQEYMRIIIS